MQLALGTKHFLVKMIDMKNKKVFVVVVTYNGMQWIDKCFSSLKNGSVPLHVIAIDNDSKDDTVYYLKNNFEDIELIQTGANLGFGKANNIGFKRALEDNADYVFLLNQDAWVEFDTIEKLIRIAEQNEEFGLISPFHLLPNTEKLEWYFSTYLVPEKCPDIYSDIYFDKVKDIYESDFINAAAWLITKACLQKVGGFDPLFPHYGEDEDYCCRVMYKKMKIGVVPDSKIYHDITYKTWDEIKFNKSRQLVFSLIELKNLKYTYRFAKFNYVKNRVDRLVFLAITMKWKEFSFMFKMLFSSFLYFRKVKKSRKISLEDIAYLK